MRPDPFQLVHSGNPSLLVALSRIHRGYWGGFCLFLPDHSVRIVQGVANELRSPLAFDIRSCRDEGVPFNPVIAPDILSVLMDEEPPSTTKHKKVAALSSSYVLSLHR